MRLNTWTCEKSVWTNKNILVTGGTGFVGRALVSRLLGLGAKVTYADSKSYDLTRQDHCKSLFRCPPLDYIFHAASWTRPGDFCLTHSAEQYHTNTLIHVNVLDAWKTVHPWARFVGIGSSCSYPGNIDVLHEYDYWNGNPHDSLHAYAMTKRMLFAGQLAYGRQYGMSSTHVIFATVYGIGDYFDDVRSHCASALIARFCKAAHENSPEVCVWGDGTQEREFVYVDDQVEGILAAALDTTGIPLVNLGAGRATTIKLLADTIATHSGFKGAIVYDTTKFVGIKKKLLDSYLAECALGWTPKTSLDEGIKKTVDWYKKTYLPI